MVMPISDDASEQTATRSTARNDLGEGWQSCPSTSDLDDAAALLRRNGYWVELMPMSAGQIWRASAEAISILEIKDGGDRLLTFVAKSKALNLTLEVCTFSRQAFIDWAQNSNARPEWPAERSLDFAAAEISDRIARDVRLFNLGNLSYMSISSRPLSEVSFHELGYQMDLFRHLEQTTRSGSQAQKEARHYAAEAKRELQRRLGP